MLCLTYRLYPTADQASRLFHYFSVSRTLYNHSLNQRIKYYKETGKSLTKYDQTADLAQLRVVSQVLRDVPSQVERDALDRLDKAFKAFFRRHKAGVGKAGFPRFKGANRWNSFGISAPWKVLQRGNCIRVSGVEGLIKARGVRTPDGEIKVLQVIHRAGKWFAGLVVDNGLPIPPKVKVNSSIGVDVGLTSFATLSDGTKIANPRFGKKLAGKLKRAQQLVSRCQKGSSNRRKAIKQLQRIHAKIADQRSNFAHQVSRKLVNEYDLIATEKLNIRGMARGRLSKSIFDACWNKLFGYLTYKAENAGKFHIQVDPRGTSQECSQCGDLVLKDLSVRVHSCPECGLTIDRDLNAARNILARATTAGRAGSNASGVATKRRRKRKSLVAST